jgi:photosynthetic reaction center H subunit
MVDAVGPAAYAMRSTKPDTTLHGENRLAPLRVAFTHSIAEESPDPRGMAVFGFDGVQAGVVRDVWVDRSEEIIRYLEVTVSATGLNVLVPMPLIRIDDATRQVKLASVKAIHFATAPLTAQPDQVSMREEDRIGAYFGSGHLYADPSRSDPLI